MQPTTNGIVTLTTDFGIQDLFVGVMKGVILGINRAATPVDITHGIPPQDIPAAALVVDAASRCFPPGTVHVVVVDPGVGSERRMIALVCRGQYFVAPDNGVLTAVRADDPVVAVSLEETVFFRKPVSATFHGRDIFAPVAAYLSRGTPLTSLGPTVTDLVDADLPQPTVSTTAIDGQVLMVDHFGNLITNICSTALEALDANIEITIGSERIADIQPSYAQAPPQAVVAVINSFEVLEIAVNQGNAAEQLQAGAGTPVRVNISAAG
jgi:hypothetical protein